MTEPATIPEALTLEACSWLERYGDRAVAASTRTQYRQECARALQGQELTGSRSKAYLRRAALIWGALEVLRLWEQGMEVTVSELRGALGLLRAYDPADRDSPPARSGGTGARGTARTHSKDHVAARLDRQVPDWRARFFAAASDLGESVSAIALVMSIPIRPAELALGVRVAWDRGTLCIAGQGTKVNEQRSTGQPHWRLWLRPDPRVPELAHLARQARAGPVVVQVSRHRLRRAVKAAARRAFGDAQGGDVSPYVFRHERAATLVNANTDPVFRAYALKHASTRSAAHYGRRAAGRRTMAIVHAEGSRLVREPAKRPALLAGPQEPVAGPAAVPAPDDTPDPPAP